MARDVLNEVAWTRLLAALDIDLAKASFPVKLSMNDLKTKGGREPRLMLSMDTREKAPRVLRSHGVFPLSISNKVLWLVKGDGWFDFPRASDSIQDFESRLPFELVSSTIGKGENAHIMRLEVSGFLRDFLGAKTLLPASSGKRMAPAFEVLVGGIRLAVKGAQYEMDLQYESEDHIVPVEAKTKAYASCAIRQVYFPYRALSEDTNWQKAVRPLFITFTEAQDEYAVRELGFRRKDVWESIHVVQDARIRLRIKTPPKKILDLDQELLLSQRLPQADAAWRIEELPVLVHRGICSAKTVSEYFQFDIRQASYYRDAAQILGLIDSRSDGTYVLTRAGQQFVNLAPQARADSLAKRMCALPAMNEVLVRLIEAGDHGLSVQKIREVLERHAHDAGEPVTGKTGSRRTQTITSWLRYIGSRTGSLAFTNGRFVHHAGLRNLDSF